MPQIVDKGDFIYIEPHYIVHKSGTICPYLRGYHIFLESWNHISDVIHGIDLKNSTLHKIRDNYIIAGSERTLKTKDSNHIFNEILDRVFVDADLSLSGQLTSIYSNMAKYFIKTGDRPEYTIDIPDDLHFKNKIWAIEGKYVMYTHMEQLCIGDEFGSINITNIVKVTDNFVVSHSDKLLGRHPICVIPEIEFVHEAMYVYLLDSFVFEPSGKKTKVAVRAD